MIIPKEKAIDLEKKFRVLLTDSADIDWYKEAKQCALTTVNEVLYALNEHMWQNRFIIDYYEEVKQEIHKL